MPNGLRNSELMNRQVSQLLDHGKAVPPMNRDMRREALKREKLASSKAKMAKAKK